LEKHAPDWLEKVSVARTDGRSERHFWQAGGGYDRNFMEPLTVRRVIDYIHGNPVRRELVHRPENWAWSSAGYYAGQGPVKLDIDTTLAATIGV
jgi:putative transposase